MAKVVFLGVGAVLVAAGLRLFQVEEAHRLAAIAKDPGASSGNRISALSRLRRVDAGHAQEVAERLLDVDSPDLRLSAAALCAQAGSLAGERVLIDMLKAEDLGLGFRGMAATALAGAGSRQGHSAIIQVASQECDHRLGFKREGIQWSLLEALSRYREGSDFDLVLELYKVTGLQAPGRPVGLFGRPESLPFLREAITRTQNAVLIIELQLAIARSGGDDGVMFVHELLRRGSTLGAVEGQIEMTKEDPLSGRLADVALRDLGAHPSDRQFFDDSLAILKPAVCTFCGSAWGAIARMGTEGYEAKIVGLVKTSIPNRSDDALRALAFNGATESVRTLARHMGKERSGEMYLAAHEKGLDRDWYPLPRRGVY
jgi:hypothetical protein